MRLFLTLIFAFAPAVAFAHIGHWGPVAGHDHIAIGITIGIAIIAGLTALGKKGKSEDASDDAPEDDEAEA